MMGNNNNNKFLFSGTRCIQLNVQRSKATTACLCEVISRRSIGIAALQELYCVSNNISGIFKGWRIFAAGTGRKRACVVLSDPNLDAVLLGEFSDEDFVAVELSLVSGLSCVFISAYFDCTSDISHDLNKVSRVLNANADKKFIMCVDSNSRSAMWHDSQTNARGKELEEFLAEKSLIVVNENDNEPTFETRNGRSNIDLTISSISMLRFVSQWENKGDELSSDHKMLQFSLGGNGYYSQTGADGDIPRYKIKGADWEAFKTSLIEKTAEVTERVFGLSNEECQDLEIKRSFLDNQISDFIPAHDDLEGLIYEFSGIFSAACEATIPRNRAKKGIASSRRTVPWWTRNLTVQRKDLRRLRRRYQRTRNNPHLREERRQEYWDLKLAYDGNVRETKENSLRNFCTGAGGENPWGEIYKMAAGKQRAPLLLTTLAGPNGEFTTGIEDTLHRIMEECVPSERTPDSDIHSRMLADAGVDYLGINDDLYFSEEEVKKVIESFASGKSPGDDGLSAEIVQCIFHCFPQTITTLYNECLRRGVFPSQWKRSEIILITKPGKSKSNDPSKYRPISLLPVLGKALEKLLINRILHNFRTRGMLSPRQFGFTPQTGAVHALVEVKNKLKNSLEAKQYTAMISLDVKGAFNGAWWPAILKSLRDKGCPKNLYRLTKAYFSERRATLRTVTTLTTRHQTVGCPQGSCCGPGYWAIMYDSILRLPYPSGVEPFAFADDLLLTCSAKSEFEVQMIANEALYLIEKWAWENNMEFNPDKTKFMMVSRRRRNRATHLYLLGVEIEEVDSIRYLGVIFDRGLRWNRHISHVSQKASQIINILARSAGVYWGMKSDALHIIYKGAILPILTYAAPVWEEALNIQSNVKTLRRAQRLMLLRIIRGVRTISFQACCVLSGIEPIEMAVRKIARCFTVVNDVSGSVDLPLEPGSWPHPARVITIGDESLEESAVFFNVFTDGSDLGNGRVGCAFVVYRQGQQQSIHRQLFRLGQDCTNNQAEALAVREALNWIDRQRLGPGSRRALIHTDSQVTLDSLADVANHLPVFEDIRALLSRLREGKAWKIGITWVKAHAGNIGNECADLSAKAAANDTALPVVFNKISKSKLKQDQHSVILDEWQQMWRSTEDGSHTRRIFPSIRERLGLNIPRTWRMTMLLSGHGRLRAYLARFNLAESAECPCQPGSVQDWDHLLLDCAYLQGPRARLQRSCILQNTSWPATIADLVRNNLPALIDFVNSVDFEVL